MQYSVSRRLVGICRLFGVSRQAFYKKQKRKETLTLHHEIVLQMVEQIRKVTQWKKMGSAKLYLNLKPQFEVMKIKMGRTALHKLIMEFGLHVRRKKKRVITTNSYHWYRKHPNLILGLKPERSVLIWVSDITYLTLKDQFVYLFLITDAYSHKIVGYQLSPRLAVQGALDALQMATDQYTPHTNESLIHHSDRGIQYACTDYVSALGKIGSKISMAAKGNPYENPMAERVNGILKDEMGLDRVFNFFDEAAHEVITTIEMYNNERRHSSINMLTPSAAHTMTGPIPKKWK